MAPLLNRSDGIFLARWLRDPLGTASVVPSGADLARLMARQVDPGRPGAVVELGAGTGVITKALLAVGVPQSRLIVFERDEVLYRLLRSRFPRVALIRADAVRLRAVLAECGVMAASAVVSSLPLLVMSESQRRAVLDQARTLLTDYGRFIQFTYGPNCPIPRRKLGEWGWRARAMGTAWMNLPPATVWRFTKWPIAARGG